MHRKTIVLAMLAMLAIAAGTVETELHVEPTPSLPAVTATAIPLTQPTAPSANHPRETPTVSVTPPLATVTHRSTPTAASQSEETVTPSTQEPRDELPQVTFAKADLARRLELEPQAIELLEVQEKTWPDTSMGCPHPDMVYTHVPQDGLLIRLRAAGQVYNYHSGGMRDPFLCEQSAIPQKTTPVLGEEDLTRLPGEQE